MFASIRYPQPCTHKNLLQTQRQIHPSTAATSPETSHPRAPTSLMHPTLMEKLRLGLPTSGYLHTDSTVPIDTVTSFYRLQDISPFPHLSPYYIHGDHGSDTTNSTSAGMSRKVEDSPATTVNGTMPPAIQRQWNG